MTPALKPGYVSDRAVCLTQPDIWINVRKDLTGFTPSVQVLESEIYRLYQHRNFHPFSWAGNEVKTYLSHEYVYLPNAQKQPAYYNIYLLNRIILKLKYTVLLWVSVWGL